MIFGSLGLLVVAGGFLAAGITKSSTGFLTVAFVCTLAAGALLLLAYSAARNAGLGAALGVAPAGAGGGQPVMGAIAGGPPGTTPVVMYVPLQQAPGAAPPTVAPSAPANGDTGNGGFAPSPPILGYDEMTADQIAKLVSSGALTDDQLRAMRDYEERGAGRKTVLDRLQKAI